MEADYQRDVVWNDAKQSNLIDSIFKDYCKYLSSTHSNIALRLYPTVIPPVLFAKRMGEDGEEFKVGKLS